MFIPCDQCPLASQVIKSIINRLFSPTDTRDKDNENYIMPEGKKKRNNTHLEGIFLTNRVREVWI